MKWFGRVLEKLDTDTNFSRNKKTFKLSDKEKVN